jgi:hypothetical protein
MKPLPDLTDVEAMASIGRESALWSARNQTLNRLRDVYTTMQSAQFDKNFEQLAIEVRELSVRLIVIAQWGIDEQRAADLKRAAIQEKTRGAARTQHDAERLS